MAEKPKRDRIFDFIKNFKADIYLLQETHNDNDGHEKQWAAEWGGRCLWSRGTNRSKGVAILLPPGSNMNISNIRRDTEGRILAATLTDQDDDLQLNIMNVYAPNIPRERQIFFDKLWQYKPGDTNILLAGDFNCIETPELDKQGGNPASGRQGIVELNQFVDHNDLHDTWRKSHPNDRLYTWHNKDFTLRSRLDRWYTQSSAKTHTSIRACPFSDHSVIELILTEPLGSKRGKGVWKINQQVIDDQSFQRDIRAFQKFWQGKKTDFPSLQEWWDQAKCHYKAIAITHAVRKSRNRDRDLRELINELNTLQCQNHPDASAIDDAKRKIEEIETCKLEGIKIRSRASWLEEGERPTKFFFSLEKRKQEKARITKLRIEQTVVTTDKDILAEAQSFYQQLYNHYNGDSDLQHELLELLEKQLSAETKESCEGPITEAEMTTARKKMHMNKSPGPDGLTTEFYHTFWNDIAPDLLEVYNDNFLRGQMSKSQQEALLRLLHKKNERELLSNWRPISLLNTDYKILATVLANRLRAALPEVIHPDQTCGIPGRTIYDTVLRLRDMAYEATAKHSNLILISLDQEKAFDRVDRNYLFNILEKMNFGTTFIRWLKTMYAGANCKIINNGWLSEPVFLERGVRQGCPLSSLLYTIVFETLTNAIRRNPRIEGVPLPGSMQHSKTTAYADDATLTLKDDLSVTRAFDVINTYEKANGSKLNMTKTEGVYVGQQAGRDHGPVPIKWKTDNITALGTKIGNDMRQDWDKAAGRLETTLSRWRERRLSCKGKAVIIQTYAIAQIVYLASMFLIPDVHITRIHRAIFQFLWNTKNELVSRATCHLPLNQGGLGIPDIHTIRNFCMIKWLKHLTNQTIQTKWSNYGRYWAGQTLGCIKSEWRWLRSNTVPHGDPHNAPKWYRTILDFVSKHRKTLAETPDDNLTNRFLKLLIRDPHQPRCVAEWNRLIHPPPTIPWNQLWASKCSNHVKEFIWRLSHRVLPTKAYLRQWGMSVSPACPFCPRREDSFHALVQCQRAQNTWTAIQPLLTAIAGHPPKIDLEALVFRRGLPTISPADELCFYLIATTAANLWKTRNNRIFDKKTPLRNVAQDTLRMIRHHIQTDFYINPNRVELFWSHKKTLAEINNGLLVLKI